MLLQPARGVTVAHSVVPVGPGTPSIPGKGPHTRRGVRVHRHEWHTRVGLHKNKKQDVIRVWAGHSLRETIRVLPIPLLVFPHLGAAHFRYKSLKRVAISYIHMHAMGKHPIFTLMLGFPALFLSPTAAIAFLKHLTAFRCQRHASAARHYQSGWQSLAYCHSINVRVPSAGTYDVAKVAAVGQHNLASTPIHT